MKYTDLLITKKLQCNMFTNIKLN